MINVSGVAAVARAFVGILALGLALAALLLAAFGCVVLIRAIGKEAVGDWLVASFLAGVFAALAVLAGAAAAWLRRQLRAAPSRAPGRSTRRWPIAIAFGVLSFAAFIGACWSVELESALAWTSVSAVLLIGLLFSSPKAYALLRTGAEPLQVGWHGMAWMFLVASAFPLSAWWIWTEQHTSPPWSPPRLENLQTLSGELRKSGREYSVRPREGPEVVLFCNRPHGSGRRGSYEYYCLPDDIAQFVGATVVVRHGGLSWSGRYHAGIWELRSGRRTLVPFEAIVKSIAAADRIDAASGAFLPASLSLFGLLMFMRFVRWQSPATRSRPTG